MRVACVVLLTTLAACSGGERPWTEPPAEPLALRAELSREEVPLLGELTVTLDLYAAGGPESVDFDPQLPDGFRGEVEPQEPVPLGEGTWQRTVLRLRPVKGPGELEIPAFTAKAGERAVSTEKLPVTVTSVLAEAEPENAGPEVEEPAPPFPPVTPWLAWTLGLLAVVGAVLGIWLLLRRRKQRKPEVREVPVPAHVRALRALARLRKAPRRTRVEVEAFYVEVSQVLRVYLEERFGLHAPERTTEEFLAELEAGDTLSLEQRAALARFLRQCDLVKFAGQQPDESVHLETFSLAEDFVESTRPDRAREGAA